MILSCKIIVNISIKINKSLIVDGNKIVSQFYCRQAYLALIFRDLKKVTALEIS